MKKERIESIVKKYLIVVFIISMFVIYCPSVVRAAAAEGIALGGYMTTDTYTEYDLDGDGKKDILKIDNKGRKKTSEFGEYKSTITINGKIVFEKTYGDITIKLYVIDSKTSYFHIFICGDGDTIVDPKNFVEGIYQYKNGMFQNIANFYDSQLLKQVPELGASVDIVKIGKTGITATYHAQLNAIGNVAWNMDYKLKGNSFKIVNANYGFNSKSYYNSIRKSNYTAAKAWTVYKKPGSSAKAFAVKKGDKLKIKKITFKGKNTYIQIANSKGKSGWFKEPKKYQKNPYFYNLVFDAMV